MDASNPIFTQILIPLIQALSALVGLLVIIMLILGGIQYMTAGGNANQVAAAKNRIFTAVVCLILFALGFALLQWLVPGGIIPLPGI